MNLSTVFRLPKGMRLRTVTLHPDTLWVEAAARRGSSACPSCQMLSEHVHSYYTRTVADLPCVGRRVQLSLRVRKFRCKNACCPQRVFSERFPGFVCPKARKTLRIGEQLRALGAALGGRGAQRLARLLGVPATDHTIVRTILAQPPSSGLASPAVRVLGVDDFAFRRGTRYGTLLMDLEQRRVIDLLPDRSQDSLAEWLRQHPGVQLITRDRSGEYAAGAALGAPDAEQIADRFHLLLNAGEVLERYLTRQHVTLREAARTLGPVDAPRRSTKRALVDIQRRQERRAARLARYEQVVALSQDGLSAHQIAQDIGISRATVYRYLAAASFPERIPPRQPRQIDPYLPYLQDRWNAGEHNAQKLWREIHAQGYPANMAQVGRLVMAWRTPPPMPGVAGAPLPAKEEAVSYSARQTRWLLTKAETELSEREGRYLATLKQLCPQIAQAQRLLMTFHAILTERVSGSLDSWLEQCEQSGLVEFVRFAHRLRYDYAAVHAAFCYPWSQGPVEGHVNRLKLLKRQMYGRAGFALLRRRMLSPPAPAP